MIIKMSRCLYLKTYLLVAVHKHQLNKNKGFPGGSDGKESACNARNPGSIPRSGRSPGERNR